MKVLAGLTRLEHLELGRTKITDAGLKELVPLKQLRLLYVGDTQVTDAGVQELKDAVPTLAQGIIR
jgi:hypothetical protein